MLPEIDVGLLIIQESHNLLFILRNQEFAETVADTFNIDKNEYHEIFHFVESGSKKITEQENQLIISSDAKMKESSMNP